MSVIKTARESIIFLRIYSDARVLGEATYMLLTHVCYMLLTRTQVDPQRSKPHVSLSYLAASSKVPEDFIPPNTYVLLSSVAVNPCCIRADGKLPSIKLSGPSHCRDFPAPTEFERKKSITTEYRFFRVGGANILEWRRSNNMPNSWLR
jgi:hypothetical protein